MAALAKRTALLHYHNYQVHAEFDVEALHAHVSRDAARQVHRFENNNAAAAAASQSGLCCSGSIVRCILFPPEGRQSVSACIVLRRTNATAAAAFLLASINV
jgi:hypothetical protein